MAFEPDSRIFPAKLLLFGEHVLLLGAPALAVPVNSFGGRWAWTEDHDRHHTRLLQFAQSEHLKSVGVLDLERFEQELKRGLYFESNIPTGYGLGSSGALCAAIYARFARETISDLSALKQIFARMESFFHGNSSGIDPLTSYVGEPVLIHDYQEVERVSIPQWVGSTAIVFLLDSNLPRRTGPLVEWFLEKSKEPHFAQLLSSEYLPAHSAMLNAWLSGASELFWANLRHVSAFQLEHFLPMVPPNLKELWAESFEHQAFVLKICGAGGGGFMLGFAEDPEVVEQLTASFQIVYP